jgi:hypothetical protein
MPAFWAPQDEDRHRLERGFCAGFTKTSFNSSAVMSPEEQQKLEHLITQFKWFTRNSETDMSLPFDEKLLYDKRFTNIAQGLLRKQMLYAPNTTYTDKFGVK